MNPDVGIQFGLILQTHILNDSHAPTYADCTDPYFVGWSHRISRF